MSMPRHAFLEGRICRASNRTQPCRACRSEDVQRCLVCQGAWPNAIVNVGTHSAGPGADGATGEPRRGFRRPAT